MRNLTTHRLLLGPQPASARIARRFAHETLRRLGAGAVVDVGALLTSELVTNAVLHGEGGPIELSIDPDQDDRRRIRITVRDGSDDAPEPRQASSDDTHGRGLRLVEILADRWGVELAGPGQGKVVWFELTY
jgi:anti-sigma regulatory factor (Ser/Thr protein kinase)